MTGYANKVATICYDFYKKSFPSKSKPLTTEWTTLASILLATDVPGSIPNFKVLCMTTGTKCLAKKQLPLDGTLVHDSHAEVLARRCFVRYLFNEIIRLQSDETYISESLHYDRSSKYKKAFSIRSDVKYVLFISHTPCK